MAGAGGSERVRPPRGEALRARWDRLGPPLKAAAAAGSPGPGNSRPTCPIEGCGERDARVLQPGCSAGRDTSGSSEHLGETQGSERALQTPGKEDSSSTKGSQVLPSWARAPCQLLPLIFRTAREKHALSPSVSKQRRATNILQEAEASARSPGEAVGQAKPRPAVPWRSCRGWEQPLVLPPPARSHLPLNHIWEGFKVNTHCR